MIIFSQYKMINYSFRKDLRRYVCVEIASISYVNKFDSYYRFYLLFLSLSLLRVKHYNAKISCKKHAFILRKVLN